MQRAPTVTRGANWQSAPIVALVADVAVRADHGPRADLRAVLDDDERLDACLLAEGHIPPDDRGRMHAGAKRIGAGANFSSNCENASDGFSTRMAIGGISSEKSSGTSAAVARES